jgi:hypothetical protein
MSFFSQITIYALLFRDTVSIITEMSSISLDLFLEIIHFVFWGPYEEPIFLDLDVYNDQASTYGGYEQYEQNLCNH